MNTIFYMLGVDIGTTSTKAVLFNREGSIIASANKGYPLYTPSTDVAEQDPDEIFDAVIQSIRKVIADSGISSDQVYFVSFGSAMHSIIPVDRSGRPLMRSLTWADNRSAAWSQKLQTELGGHAIYLRTGTPIHPMSPLTKLLWLRHEEPDIFNQAYKFISIKEYVFAKLFGQYIIDYSIASATGYFNLKQLDWDEEALSIAGITSEQLSSLVPTTHIIRGLVPQYAAQMGLSESIPFVIGASDGVLSNLGVDAIEPGSIAITIGTSGAIRTVVDHPVTDPQGRTFCYALTDQLWVIGGAVNNGGGIFRWLRDELAHSEMDRANQLGINAYDMLTEMASKVSAGSEGLLFHPYLAGERAPLWNPNARGSFFGLTLHHKKEHIIRSVLEGVIYNLYTVFLAMDEQIGKPKRIQATGGFARSSLWRQMLADIFNQQVVFPEAIESPCLGAVILGMYALGEINSLHIPPHFRSSSIKHCPITANTAIYHELLPIYMNISHKLTAEYDAIAKFQRKGTTW